MCPDASRFFVRAQGRRPLWTFGGMLAVRWRLRSTRYTVRGALRACPIRLKNDGAEDLWVTMLYLDANLGIDLLNAGSIRQGTAWAPRRAVMSAENHSTGLEGIVIFASPLRRQKLEPDYHFLEQKPLLIPDERLKDVRVVPDTPFAKLMNSAAFGGGTRGMEPQAASTPAIISRSWILLDRPEAR